MVLYAHNFNGTAYLISFLQSWKCQKYSDVKCFRRCLSAFLALGLFSVPHLNASEYINVPMDLSSWSFKGGKFECKLIHSTVPQGKFYFRLLPNDNVSFVAELSSYDDSWNRAVLQSVPAPWQKGRESIVIDTLEVANDQKSLVFQRGVSELLESVHQGRWVTLSLSGSNDSLELTIPTIQMKASLDSLDACRSELPKMTFAQARDVVLPFAFGQLSLTDAQAYKLRALKSYIIKDARITRILVDGYTDNVGSSVANLSVSRKRAEKVADMLTQLGIDKGLIEVRAHGARYPVASNSTADGRDKNRRVTLRLVRDNEEIVPRNSRNTEINKNKVIVQ
ncbi:MotY family protein [Vibrio rotiferianus]|uniref:MotY family protein n=1 Tax=Vibrio rotiferianus TaxID=190895 RepID=UPI002893986A|nr:Flagellar protein MotY [Vibrio rotiferianus]